MVRETQLLKQDLIYPLFVCEGEGIQEEISGMPGQKRFSLDRLVEEVKQVVDCGLGSVILFGIPEKKDSVGSEAWREDGIVQRAIQTVKEIKRDICVVGDVCLCQYTEHGHCGVVQGESVDNDSSLELLTRVAVSQAKAGADIIAPSDMMDGRIGAIRQALDAAGFAQLPIMAYGAKYASAFYGPFREAAQSAPKFGDRRSYQMDVANRREALRELALDLEEGADILMIKPALAYLDVIAAARERFDVPIAAYNVSGEYAMVCAAAANGWLDRRAIIMETLTAIKRAGADLILTYFAKEVAADLPQ